MRVAKKKASDVNVAAHLLLGALQGSIDAAIVVSNDSDLRFPMQEARKRVPVGTVNPSGAYLAGALRGQPSDGVGGHWWRQLTTGDFFAHQAADKLGDIPPGPLRGRVFLRSVLATLAFGRAALRWRWRTCGSRLAGGRRRIEKSLGTTARLALLCARWQETSPSVPAPPRSRPGGPVAQTAPVAAPSEPP